MNHHKLIKIGPCPVCGRVIVDKGKPNQFYTTFFVRYTDGTNAEYAICKDCRPKLTKEQVDEICENQIFTWGQEIVRQQIWFSTEAIFLRPKSWADTKEKLIGP